MWPEQNKAKALQQDVMDSLDKEFYSATEVARRLGRKDQTVYDMIEKGEIPSVVISTKGKRRRVVAKKTLAKLLAPTPMDNLLRDLGFF